MDASRPAQTLRTTSIVLVAVAASLLVPLPADAQAPHCQVPPFSGASGPKGATASMRVVNVGQPCGITLYGVPAARQNPAAEGVIVHKPKHGTAEFVGARLQYTPAPGFAGEDAFSAQAWAIGESRSRHLLKIQVVVQVVPGQR